MLLSLPLCSVARSTRASVGIICNTIASDVTTIASNVVIIVSSNVVIAIIGCNNCYHDLYSYIPIARLIASGFRHFRTFNEFANGFCAVWEL